MKGPPFWGSGRRGSAACLPSRFGNPVCPTLGLESWGPGTLGKLEAGSCLSFSPAQASCLPHPLRRSAPPDIPDALIFKAHVPLDSTPREGHFTSFEPQFSHLQDEHDGNHLRFLGSCCLAPTPYPPPNPESALRTHLSVVYSCLSGI